MDPLFFLIVALVLLTAGVAFSMGLLLAWAEQAPPPPARARLEVRSELPRTESSGSFLVISAALLAAGLVVSAVVHDRRP